MFTDSPSIARDGCSRSCWAGSFSPRPLAGFRLPELPSRSSLIPHWLCAVLLLAPVGHAQTDSPSTNLPLDAVESAPDSWSFGISVAAYLVPDSREYVQPTFTADRGWLHVEARYNYESLETGSVWLGCNLGGGEKVEWSLSPIVGGVFGELDGIAPGCKLDVSWWKLALYSEGEYVVDLADGDGAFFYNWSEFSVRLVDWFRLGMVTQRTRLYDSDRDIQRGFLVGAETERFAFTSYVLNPDANQPTIVFAVSFSY